MDSGKGGVIQYCDSAYACIAYTFAPWYTVRSQRFLKPLEGSTPYRTWLGGIHWQITLNEPHYGYELNATRYRGRQVEIVVTQGSASRLPLSLRKGEEQLRALERMPVPK